MKLGFYYHIPAIEINGNIFMPGYLGLFIDSLAIHFTSIVTFQHLPDAGENTIFDYQIRSKNVLLVSLAPRGSVPHRMLHMREFTRKIKKHEDEFDAILLRGPTPLLPPIANKINKPSILLIVGDQLAGVDSLPQPRWRKELIRAWSWYNAQRQLQVARRSLVFVNSKLLFRQFESKVPNLHGTHTTTLSIDDLYFRDDTCEKKPVRLLYTGRFDPAKGLLDIVEAVAILVDQGIDIVFDLVGWADKGSEILAQIDQTASKFKISDRIINYGYKAVGPDLFSYYKIADVYIIASQSSFEGFPRTIWEAMAHSLPVVATKVGSIPDFIQGAAELVEARNPHALAEGIKRLINNPETRKEYIKKGLVLARQNSLEIQVCEMVKVIKKWMDGNNG